MNQNDNHTNDLKNKIKEMQKSIEKIYNLIILHLQDTTKSTDSEEYQRFMSYLTYISDILEKLRLQMQSKQ
jgi:hypothetical protein